MLITDIPVWDTHSSYNRISAVDPVLAGLNTSKRSPLSNVTDVLDYRRWTKQIHVSFIYSIIQPHKKCKCDVWKPFRIYIQAAYTVLTISHLENPLTSGLSTPTQVVGQKYIVTTRRLIYS